MKTQIPTDKSAKYEAVAKAVLELLAQSGVSGVSHSKVARLSKVSRPWIYKYVGKTQSTLIQFSAVHFGQKLLEVGKSSRMAEKPQELTELALQSTWQLLEKFSDWKEILPLYFRYAGTKNPLGLMIANLENDQLKEMSQALSRLFKISAKEARMTAEIILAIRMGVGFRYAQIGLKQQGSLAEIQQAMRRVFEHSAVILKQSEKT